MVAAGPFATGFYITSPAINGAPCLWIGASVYGMDSNRGALFRILRPALIRIVDRLVAFPMANEPLRALETKARGITLGNEWFSVVIRVSAEEHAARAPVYTDEDLASIATEELRVLDADVEHSATQPIPRAALERLYAAIRADP